MVYLICFALLVIVGAWLIAAYSRFNHLYTQVQDSWRQWEKVTRVRNERMGDFARLFSAKSPQDSILPRHLRRLVDDSARALSAASADPAHVHTRAVTEAEKKLRQAMATSVSALENDTHMRADRRLMQLCTEMSVSMVQQDQFAHFYNRHAGVYNSALNSPSGRLFGPMMGFSPVERI